MARVADSGAGGSGVAGAASAGVTLQAAIAPKRARIKTITNAGIHIKFFTLFILSFVFRN